MGAKHTKPCGAFADVKELEYISALHQTGTNGLRKDGSIHAVDIKMFLMSRYGIKTTEDEVRMRIMGAFGECARRGVEDEPSRPEERSSVSSFVGGDAESGHVEDSVTDDFNGNRSDVYNDFLDLTQVLALLLVPELLKAERSMLRQQQEEQAQPELASTFAVHHHSENGGKYWPDADLIANVQRMILRDATGDPNPRPLTRDLLRQILTFYGERRLAEDEELLDNMLMAANHKSNPSADENAPDVVSEAPVLFDRCAFARALTHDVQRYNIDDENRMTSNYYDVFKSFDSTGKNKNLTCVPHLRNPFKTEEILCESGIPVQKVFTFGSIDFTADTFRERGFVVVLWTTWIASFSAYLRDRSKLLSLTVLDCGTSAGCEIKQQILNWLVIMMELSILGTGFIVSASLGNSVYATNLMWIIVGMGAVACFVMLPYFSNVGNAIFSTEKSEYLYMQIAYYVSLIGGFLLLAASVLNIIQRRYLDSSSTNKKLDWFWRFLVPGMVRLESKLKRAASYKMNLMMRNACEVHKTAQFDDRSSRGEGETVGNAMLTFTKSSDRTEDLPGGVIETWKRIFSGSLFEEDGIWFSTHLLAGNLAQSTLFMVLGAIFYVVYKSDSFQVLLTILDDLGSSLRWRLTLPLFGGIVCSELAVFLITVNYIPSTVRTILQYRSGGIGSLHSNRFQTLRLAVDQSTLVFPAMFWGTLYTSVAIGFFVMIVSGLLLWPDFAEDAIFIVATLSGIIITMLVKWIALVGYRRYNQSGFYRKSVALANLLGLILESWNLGLTSIYMAFRSINLLATATLFIGRIDSPFLSEHATYLGPFQTDAFPLLFRKDILAHEAHRHPYLERMGVMYMLKLRHDDFGRFAGTCWRMLFVYALAPWMRKYRFSEGFIEVIDFRFSSNRTWTSRMPPELSSNKVLHVHARVPSGQNDQLTTEDDTLSANMACQNKLLKKENEILWSLLQRNNQRGEVSKYNPFSPGISRSRSTPDLGGSGQPEKSDGSEGIYPAGEVSTSRSLVKPVLMKTLLT